MLKCLAAPASRTALCNISQLHCERKLHNKIGERISDLRASFTREAVLLSYLPDETSAHVNRRFEPCEVPIQEECLAVTGGVQPSELIKQYSKTCASRCCDFRFIRGISTTFLLLSFFSRFVKRAFYYMRLEGFRSSSRKG